jgi:hypothetical protein
MAKFHYLQRITVYGSSQYIAKKADFNSFHPIRC